MLQNLQRYDLALAELRDVVPSSKGNPHYPLSSGIDCLIRGFKSRERITEDQRDELGAVLDEITFHVERLMVGNIDRVRFEDGMAALVSLCWLWGEDPERRPRSDEVADAFAHARMLQNWAHNVSLAREILGRAEKRQRAFVDRYLAPAGDMFS
jgi:hypothetical protein